MEEMKQEFRETWAGLAEQNSGQENWIIHYLIGKDTLLSDWNPCNWSLIMIHSLTAFSFQNL